MRFIPELTFIEIDAQDKVAPRRKTTGIHEWGECNATLETRASAVMKGHGHG